MLCSIARTVFAAAALGVCTSNAIARTPAPPANPPPRPASDVYFGTTVTDPYRYLEDKKNPEVAAWMKASSDYARTVLDAIPGRKKMAARVKLYEDAVPARVTGVRRRPGDLYFYEKRGVADEQFKLYVRYGLSGREQLLVDPEAIARQRARKPLAINFFEPSHSGRYLAFGMSQSGSEDAILFVLEVATGKTVLGPIDRAQFADVSWLEDDSGFFMNRLQQMTPGMAEVEKYQKSRAIFIRMDGKADQASTAPTALAFDTPGVTIDPVVQFPAVAQVPGQPLAVGVVYHGTDRELTAYIAPLADAVAGRAKWRKLFDRKDNVTGFEIIGNRLLLLTYTDAPRFRLIQTTLLEPDLARARTLVPQSEGVLTGMAYAADGLYLSRRDGAVSKLLRLDLEQGAAAQIELPLAGSFEIGGVDHRLPGVLLTLQSWTRAPQVVRVLGTSFLGDTGLQPGGKYDALPDYVSTEVLVPSHDGAKVPLSIIHKRGLPLDGKNPTILWGYASYGITEEPWFSPWRLAWLERGGIFAVANPRGSGAFGQDWYKAGFQATKPNSWKDFIATAQYLIDNKYTSPAQLGIWGGSAGGILIGRALTERPDLFAAAVPAVGALDMVRAELTPNGVSNVPEFGTHKTEAGFRALLAMSTYHHITAGVKYPAALFTHGVNDPRVDVWQSVKTAARLSAETAGNKPVLLLLDYESGHGIGDTKAQRQRERADVMSFFLWQFGAKEFQPR